MAGTALVDYSCSHCAVAVGTVDRAYIHSGPNSLDFLSPYLSVILDENKFFFKGQGRDESKSYG